MVQSLFFFFLILFGFLGIIIYAFYCIGSR